jgi:hypothetical protein
VSDIERSGSLSMWQLFFTHPLQHRKLEFDAVERSLFWQHLPQRVRDNQQSIGAAMKH